MKLKDAIRNLDFDRSISTARRIAQEEGLVWDDGIRYVFTAIVNAPERTPEIGSTNDDESATIRKWVRRYKNAYITRASQRISNLPGTIIDPILEKIIKARLTHLTNEDIKKIEFAHRLEMSAENILGLYLEEYLADNLKDSGWHCAWGETVKSVDFINEDGHLLQIKNRDNSENSSSSAIRTGTEIQKWFRVKSTRVEYMWDVLNEICGTDHLSEEDFVNFTEQGITNNPQCLAVEEDNPWKRV